MSADTPVVPQPLEPLLRDLSEEEFTHRYGCDRFTATVLSNRYRYTVQHMCTGLLHNAFSVILRDWYDFAATISGPGREDYPLGAVSNSLALFTGTLGDALRNVVEEWGPDRLGPGAVLLCNDRMDSRPLFHEDPALALVSLRAHMRDMGGVFPTGFSGTKRNIYENGLV